MIDDLKKA